MVGPRRSTAVKTGQIHGADYLIYASVNEFTPVKSRTGGTAEKLASLSLVGVNRSVSEVAMSFRVVDATIERATFQYDRTRDRGKLGRGSCRRSAARAEAVLPSKNASPIGYAVQSCINKGVYTSS